MAAPNVDKLSLKDLIELESKVRRAIGAARDRERAELRAEFAALAEKRGIPIAEVMGGRGRGRSSAAGAKFVNPDNRTETWSGRGRKPNWLVAKLNKGAKMSDFAV